jgi:hypothetical protein
MKNTTLATFFSIAMLCFAFPSYSLPTSDLWIPTTEVMKKSYLRLDMQQDFALIGKESGESNYYSSFGAVVGLYENPSWGLEAGIDYVEPRGNKSIDAINFSAKASYLPTVNGPWRLAFGVRDLSLSSETNAQIMYLVTDINPFETDVTRLGVYLGNSSVLTSGTGEASASGLLLAYYRKLKEDWGKLAIEWISGKNFYSGILIGSHFRFSEGVDCVVGYRIPNDSSFQQSLNLRISLYY